MAAVNLEELFCRHFELSNGNEITFHQSTVGDVGCVVWDAALVLSSYFLKCCNSSFQHMQVDFNGKSVLEVGSGTGAVGLVTACLGARAVVTDLPVFVPLMEYNINVNKDKLKGFCSARSLTWGEKEQMHALRKSDFPNGADFIILSDCVYYEESLEPLIQTILFFTSELTQIFCSMELRDLGKKPNLLKKFFEVMRKYFNVSEVPLSMQDPYYSSPDISIVCFIPRSDFKREIFHKTSS